MEASQVRNNPSGDFYPLHVVAQHEAGNETNQLAGQTPLSGQAAVP